MVKKFAFLSLFGFFISNIVSAVNLPDKIIGHVNLDTKGTLLRIVAQENSRLEWQNFSVAEDDFIDICLPTHSDEIVIVSERPCLISGRLRCNGHLKIVSSEGLSFDKTAHLSSLNFRASTLKGTICHLGFIQAAEIIFEAQKIILEKDSILDASGYSKGGKVSIGGGWQGKDTNITNAELVWSKEGSYIFADALQEGSGGSIVLWANQANYFEGMISAQGRGVQGQGGKAEVSSGHFLSFTGHANLASPTSKGELLLDPVSITVQAASPDINGNGSGLDITFSTQLNNAVTTPAGFPNANSIITAGALVSLLNTNVSMTLAAQSFITFNAAVNSIGTGTLTLQAPTVNLNQPISLPSGTLTGLGVSTVNVGASGNAQNGVDAASNGAIVNLATATYIAPINIINKNITLNGNGEANTTILCTGALPSHISHNPLIYVEGGSAVNIQNLTVDGNYVGFPTNANITGIVFNGAQGTISTVHVTHIANTPPPYAGGQQGIGIRIQNSSGTVAIESCLIDFFQKAAIVANGTGNVTINNTTITGTGTPQIPAGPAIQFSNGTTGSITNSSISGFQFTDHAASDGILLFNAGANITISGNTIFDNDEGILAFGAGDNLVIENNTMTNNGDSGVVVYDTQGTSTIASNTFTNNGTLAAPGNVKANLYLFSTTTQLFLVNNNTFTTAAGTSAIFTQGNAANQAPNIFLIGNIFVDPPNLGSGTSTHLDILTKVMMALVL